MLYSYSKITSMTNRVIVFIVFFFISIIFFSFSNPTDSMNGIYNDRLYDHHRRDVENIIRKRMNILQRVGESHSKISCDSMHYIVVQDHAYGRTSNSLLELINGIWMAESPTMNRTLKVPTFIKDVLTAFHNGTSLLSRYCLDMTSDHVDGFWMRADQLLHINQWFKPNHDNVKFILSNETISNATNIWLTVLSTLWSNIDENVIHAAIWLINNKLNGTFNYTTVHKRFLEGSCPHMLREISVMSDFNSKELPMDHPAWKDMLRNTSHPLCAMPISFIKATQQLNHRENQRIFLAHDGFENIRKYILEANAVTSEDLDFELFPMFTLLDHRRFLDMFLAIHGDFFIMNPRSTYSWCIFVVRTILGLDTVPIVHHRDLYFNSDKDYMKDWNGKRWVSPQDIIRAAHSLQVQLKIDIE